MAVGIAAIIITVMFLFALSGIECRKKQLVNNFVSSGIQEAMFISKITKQALATNDYELINELPSTIENKKIIHFGIISNENTFIVDTDESLSGQMLMDSDVLKLIDKKIKLTGSESADYIWTDLTGDRNKELLVIAPVNVDGEYRGCVELLFSTKHINNFVKQTWKTWFIRTLLMVVLIMILVFFSVNRAVKPLHKLIHVIKELNEKGLTSKFNVETNDEIEILSNELNSMTENWQAVVSDRENKRQEADAQRKFSEAIVENIANGIVVIDTGGIITNANQAMEKNMRFGEDIVGKRFSDVFPEWEGESTEEKIQNTLSRGEVYINDRIYEKLPDSMNQVVFNVHIRPMKGDGGNIIGAVVLFQFLTDKVQLEEHMLRVNEELKRANEVKNEFLSTVSHELRTPLTLIKMYSSMLAEKKLGPLSEKQEKAVEVLNRRCRNLNDLIDDLLDLSRIEAGKLELELDEVNIHEILTETEVLFRTQAEQKGLELKISCEDDLKPIIADKQKLQRVANNLIENAVKFTDSGVIEITAGADPGDNNYARFCITDTGIGIREEYSKNIFDKFYQVDGTDTRKHSGSGLGLSIAKEIISNHHGQLWLDKSEEGKGSCFCFTVPFFNSDLIHDIDMIQSKVHDRQDISPTKDEFMAENHEQRRFTILLVDDDRDFLDLMRDILTENGYNTLSAEDGLQAFEILFSDEQIDIVLLDIAMPKMSGFDLCKALKSFEATKDIPVLMLTAAGQNDQVSKGYKSGAAGYLVKPFEIGVFKNTLERILEED